MDTPSTLLRPRLRLFRRSPSPRRVADGGSDATPRSLFPAIHDELEDEYPTPRIHPRPILETTPSTAVVSAETPAARLRALLARELRSPRPTTTPPPAPSSDADSAAEPTPFGSSTSSVARDSLKDIFSRALREPGDTPQKGRPRRNSFDGSSMEITPVVDRDRGHRRAARRSLSDEEAEKPKSNRRVDPSFRLSTALTFDTLRARLVSSRSQFMDQNPPQSLYDPSSSSSYAQHIPQPSTSVRVDPQVSTLPSFQMSSQLASQSNLLEQDSEMQRAMGDILNSENEASTSAPSLAHPNAIPSDSPPFPLKASKSDWKPEPGRADHELGSSATNFAANGATGREHHSQPEGHNHQREREWNRPRHPSRPNTPEVHRRHSQEFRRLSQELRVPSHTKSVSHESVMSQSTSAGSVRQPQRRGSLASLRSFDEDRSSRPSSVGSQADYRDRISELDRERSYEREREWNKRHLPSRPSSSLSTSSNHSFSHSHSHPPHSPSTTPYLTPTHASFRRKSSRTSLRSDSPASLASSRDSLKEREQEEKKEVTHERERNWNSPRPHWSTSKSPPTSHFKIRNNSLRGDSNGHGDASQMSTKLQNISPPKADPPFATSPALLKSRNRSNSSGGERAVSTVQSTQFKNSSPSKPLGVASKFGWNFARSSLPPLELDDRTDHRRSSPSPPSGSQPTSRVPEAIVSSQIPMRPRLKDISGPGHAASDMSLTHVVGEESCFQQDHQNRQSDVVEPHSHGKPLTARNPWSQENMELGTDEESIVDFPPQSTTPRSNPPNFIPEEIETETETEVLTSPSPRASPQLGASVINPTEASQREVNDVPRARTLRLLPEKLPTDATPPGTPPSASPRSQLSTSGASPSFSLVTPPRGTSFGSSTLDFRTPSPPHDLPDLPGPPSSSDDDALGGTPTKDEPANANLNFTLTKTPKPPGAWAATPLPPKSSRRSSSPSALFPLESTPPASTSTPLPRANTYPHARADTATDDPGEDGLLTPVGTLPRAKSLPLRTPVPPGAWVATPGQSALLSNGVDQSQYGSLGRRKGLLKVRFDVAESETSATEGHSNSPLSAIRLANPEPPSPELTTDRKLDRKVEANEGPQSTTSALHQRPTTPERALTPISRENGLSPRSLRKSPSIRLVDAYGRERIDEVGTAKPLTSSHADTERKTTPSPPTPRRSLVRVVDAMGREVDDSMGISNASKGRANWTFEADMSVVSDDTPVGHAEALTRMRKTLKDLAETLSDTDRSEDLELNSSHLEQLEEVSKAARVARNQLAHNLQLETEKEHDLLHDSKSKSPARTCDPLSVTTKKSYNTVIIYISVIVQLLLVLAMWRYAHAEARRLFYTTYYDSLYPEFTPIQENLRFSGTLSTSQSWTMLDSYETIQREGWRSIRKEMVRAMRHVGDQAWERWGEKVHFEKPT